MKEEKARKLGEYIKNQRKKKKKSAREFGEYVGYSQSYISALENNRNKNIPNRNVLHNLASALESIGYDRDAALKDMNDIAGYKDATEELDNHFTHEINKGRGFYDNISNQMLEKPYFNLNYLLRESGINLYFPFDKNDTFYIEKLNKKQTEFIASAIEIMLEKDGIHEKAEEEHSKMLAENEILNLEAFMDENLDRQRRFLTELNSIKNNFSEDKYEEVFKKYYHSGFSYEFDDIPKEPEFSKAHFDRVLEITKKEIKDYRDKIDRLGKEGD